METLNFGLDKSYLWPIASSASFIMNYILSLFQKSWLFPRKQKRQHFLFFFFLHCLDYKFVEHKLTAAPNLPLFWPKKHHHLMRHRGHLNSLFGPDFLFNASADRGAHIQTSWVFWENTSSKEHWIRTEKEAANPA